jgi:hypothetical protein
MSAQKAPRPSRPRSEPEQATSPFGAISWIVGITAMVLIGAGQYAWSAERKLLGAILVGVGGLALGIVFVVAALAGLSHRRRR